MRAGRRHAVQDRNPGRKEAEVAKAKKFYAVRKGRTPGIYLTWDDCKAQVNGFGGAEYKGFSDIADAAEYLGINSSNTDSYDGMEGGSAGEISFGTVKAYIDGSYDEAGCRYSCGVVIIRPGSDGGREIEKLSSVSDNAENAKYHNVAGEIMGSRLAIDYCLKNGIKAVTIYHDYEGIGAWADRRWKTNNPLTAGYAKFVAEARKTMDIKFIKVKGHAGNRYNELADRLAGEALKETTPEEGEL